LGRERSRTREYLHLLIACIIFITPVGCAGLKEMRAKRTAHEHLVAAQQLLDQGDYEGSLKENQKVLSSHYNVPPGDQALFNTGLIYAHYGYRRKDDRKSIDYFRRLVKIFPQSPLAGQAKIWIETLQENERLKRETQELNRVIKKSKQVDIEVDGKKKEHSR
jgi:outer membrane protein assembly factor BamD (BamD/ComL family)